MAMIPITAISADRAIAAIATIVGVSDENQLLAAPELNP